MKRPLAKQLKREPVGEQREPGVPRVWVIAHEDPDARQLRELAEMERETLRRWTEAVRR